MQYIYFQFPDMDNISCAFTLSKKKDGECANLSKKTPEDTQSILEKQKLLQDELGFEQWLELKQTHGPDMVFYPRDFPNSEAPPKADAVATQSLSKGLIIKVADCQPVLLAHKSGKYIAGLHVGWRANRANYLEAWIKGFCNQYRISPSEIMAVRGPSLGPQKSEFRNFNQEWGEGFREYFDLANSTLNLWKLTREQLQNSGIPREQIFELDLCTFTLREIFFSYRRDWTPYRQIGLIVKH